VQGFRGGLVFKDHGLCLALNARLESNKEEEDEEGGAAGKVDCEGQVLDASALGH
jgi:hypothetical protein